MAGEMSKQDIQKDGEDYEWAQHIKFAALRLMRMTHRKIKLEEMRPFDKYQGPYASLNHGSLWTNGENPKCFFYNGPIQIEGTLREIADAILSSNIV